MSSLYTREKILQDFECIEFDEDFLNERQSSLTKFIYDFDVEVVEKLLRLGCDPCVDCYNQYETRNHGFLHSLIQEFHNQHTLKGEVILQVSELLLKFGADPNQPGSCNNAPIQLCNSKISDPFKNLLLQYGAKPEGNPRF